MYSLQDLKTRVIDKHIARQAIIKWHYSHTCPASLTLCVGTYYKDDLVNCICFKNPTTRYMSQEVWEGGTDSNTIELVRMISVEPKPKNLESFCISRALNLLKEYCPQYKVCISYADNAMGHHGYCYQASNFVYYGQSGKSTVYVVNGERLHSKTIWERYGTNRWDKLVEMLGDSIKKEEIQETKSRYYKIIAQNKKEAKEIESKIKVKSYPYPKGDNEKYDYRFYGKFAKEQSKENELVNKQFIDVYNIFDSDE